MRTGRFLPLGTPPTPPPPKPNDNWSPFTSRAGFELAELLYTSVSLSNTTIDRLLDLWTATLIPHNDAAPFSDRKDLHSAIDAIKLDSVPWKSYTARYNSLYTEGGPIPEWMTNDYQLWYRDPCKVIHNILANSDLADGMDYVPYREFEDGKRHYRDFMSGNWAWGQCVRIPFVLRMVTCTNSSSTRILSLKTRTHTEHSLFPSYWGVTKQLCPLQRASMNTTPSISRLGTCATTFGEPTNMRSS